MKLALLLAACASALRASRGGPPVGRRGAGAARRLTPEDGAEDVDYERAYRALVDAEPTLSERFKRLRSGATTKAPAGAKSLDPPTRPPCVTDRRRPDACAVLRRSRGSLLLLGPLRGRTLCVV